MHTQQHGDYQFDIYLNGLQGKLPRYPNGRAGDGNTQRASVDLLAIRDRASDARWRDPTRPVGVPV
jgi:hypothetical protein